MDNKADLLIQTYKNYSSHGHCFLEVQGS